MFENICGRQTFVSRVTSTLSGVAVMAGGSVLHHLTRPKVLQDCANLFQEYVSKTGSVNPSSCHFHQFHEYNRFILPVLFHRAIALPICYPLRMEKTYEDNPCAFVSDMATQVALPLFLAYRLCESMGQTYKDFPEFVFYAVGVPFLLETLGSKYIEKKTNK